jgi:hypothetical protein
MARIYEGHIEGHGGYGYMFHTGAFRFPLSDGLDKEVRKHRTKYVTPKGGKQRKFFAILTSAGILSLFETEQEARAFVPTPKKMNPIVRELLRVWCPGEDQSDDDQGNDDQGDR